MDMALMILESLGMYARSNGVNYPGTIHISVADAQAVIDHMSSQRIGTVLLRRIIIRPGDTGYLWGIPSYVDGSLDEGCAYLKHEGEIL